MWAEFADLTVQKWGGGSPLLYEHDIISQTTESLLNYGEGNCDAWSDIFIHALRIQGIGSGVAEAAKIVSTQGDGFIVEKAWQWGAEIAAPAGYPSYTYLYTDNLFQGAGNASPGQGHGNPKARFNYHVVVKLNGKVYDPSYGMIWDDIEDFNDSVVAGVWVEFTGSPFTPDDNVFWQHKRATGEMLVQWEDDE